MAAIIVLRLIAAALLFASGFIACVAGDCGNEGRFETARWGAVVALVALAAGGALLGVS